MKAKHTTMLSLRFGGKGMGDTRV